MRASSNFVRLRPTEPHLFGSLPEWLNGTVLKTVILETVSGVRIPELPHPSISCWAQVSESQGTEPIYLSFSITVVQQFLVLFVEVRILEGQLIFTIMACHCLYLKNSDEFYSLLKSRDSDIIMKMVKCVLSAAKRNKKTIDIFDITFKNTDGLIFTIDKSQYTELLSNCLNDLIALEEYELCADIKKFIDRKSKNKKSGDVPVFDQ